MKSLFLVALALFSWGSSAFGSCASNEGICLELHIEEAMPFNATEMPWWTDGRTNHPLSAFPMDADPLSRFVDASPVGASTPPVALPFESTKPTLSVDGKTRYAVQAELPLALFADGGTRIALHADVCRVQDRYLFENRICSRGDGSAGNSFYNSDRSIRLVVPRTNYIIFSENFSRRAPESIFPLAKDFTLPPELLDPERAAKAAATRLERQKLERILEELRSRESEMRDEVARIDAKLKELAGKGIREISPEMFQGMESYFAEAIELILAAKRTLDDNRAVSKEAIAKAQGQLNDLRVAVEGALQGVPDDWIDVDVSLPPDLEVEHELKRDESDPFDDSKDPYGTSANAFIAEASALWRQGNRIPLLTLTRSWLKNVDEMRVSLEARALVSPKEYNAYLSHIEKVHAFLFGEGCGGQGCFTPDLWYRDSPVALHTRSLLDDFARGLATLSKMMSELHLQLDEVALQRAGELVRSWTTPLTPAQETVLRAFEANMEAMGAFAAFFEMRRDLEHETRVDALRQLRNVAQNMAQLVVTASDVGSSSLPLLGDALDFCEMLTGMERCDNSRPALSRWQRVGSAMGVFIGSRLFWSALAEHASGAIGSLRTIARDVEELFASGRLNSATDAIAAMGQRKFAHILKLPKGTRPNPESYLPKEYIEKHLAKFNDGGSKFMLKENFDRHGPAHKDGTSYILPKKEADQILVRSGGASCEIEKALGFEPGSLTGRELVRVDIANPRKMNLRVPSGNEAGTNDFWLPGGMLPKGNAEAVVDLSSAPRETWTVMQLSIK